MNNIQTFATMASGASNIIIENSSTIKAIQLVNSDINLKLSEHKELILTNTCEIRQLNNNVTHLNEELKEFKESTNKRIDEVKEELKEFKESTNKRIDETNKRIDEVKEELKEFKESTNKRIDEVKEELKENNKKLDLIILMMTDLKK